MKIIDLLNKIANNEEVPKYVQFYNMIKKETDTMMVCKENIIYKLDQLEIQLNSRVEIVEEDKKIEKLPYYSLKRIRKAKNEDEWREERITLLEIRLDDYHKKINELIDEVNKLKESE